MGLGWPDVDDLGVRMVVVMTVVAIMTEVLDRDDIVVAVMGSTVQLWLLSMVSVVCMVVVLVESGLMAMVARLNLMPRLLTRRKLYHSWVMKLWVGKMPQSLLFHISCSSAVPYLLRCQP